MLAMSEHVAGDPILVTMLVSIAIQDTAASALETSLDALSDRPGRPRLDCFAPVNRLFLLGDDLDAHQREVGATCRKLAGKPYYEAKPGWDKFEHWLKTGSGGLLTRLLVPPVTSCPPQRRPGPRPSTTCCERPWPRADFASTTSGFPAIWPNWSPP